MPRYRFLRVTMVATIVFATGVVIAQVVSNNDDTPELELTIKIKSSEGTNPTDIPAEIAFKNVGEKTVRILNLFDSSISPKALFSVTWSDSNGTPVLSTGGGKIALSEKSEKYVELKEGGEFSTKINLREFVPTAETLQPGLYEVQVTYRNQYGEKCFKGRLDSNKVNVVLN